MCATRLLVRCSWCLRIMMHCVFGDASNVKRTRVYFTWRMRDMLVVWIFSRVGKRRCFPPANTSYCGDRLSKVLAQSTMCRTLVFAEGVAISSDRLGWPSL